MKVKLKRHIVDGAYEFWQGTIGEVLAFYEDDNGNVIFTVIFYGKPKVLDLASSDLESIFS